MFIKRLAFVLVIMLPALFCFACDCANNGSFLKMAKDDEVTVVALIKVLNYVSYGFNRWDSSIKFPTAMMVEMVTEFKGSEARKTFVTLGNTGNHARFI